MIAADAPPALVQPAPEPVTLSRRETSEVVAASDLPLTLAKGAQRERTLVRRAVFVTSVLRVVRPPDGADRYIWTHQAYLHRQVCVTSLVGLFACTSPDLDLLPDAEKGEAVVEAPDAFPLAEAARLRLAEGLKARAPAMMEADRKARVEPLLRAAGVTVAAAARPAAARRR